jgi:uroporphyrinogen decarboxylase
MRRAGRYMPEYRAVRKQYSLIEICEKPQLAAQVIIEAPENFFSTAGPK